jgi:hypothetical protein
MRDTIEMGREAGVISYVFASVDEECLFRLKAFEALVRADERALAAPVATVIEELEHDGEGFCAKVRWLYNPVPLGETLSWEQPK